LSSFLPSGTLAIIAQGRGAASAASRRLATAGDLPDGQISDLPVQPELQKFFASAPARNSFIDSSRPVSIRGALRGRHERWVRDAMDARHAKRRMALVSRTAKSCGPVVQHFFRRSKNE
jgi:hypothetical protein